MIKRILFAVDNLSGDAEDILNFIDGKVVQDYQVMVDTGIQYLKDSKSMIEDFELLALVFESDQWYN